MMQPQLLQIKANGDDLLFGLTEKKSKFKISVHFGITREYGFNFNFTL